MKKTKIKIVVALVVVLNLFFGSTILYLQAASDSQAYLDSIYNQKKAEIENKITDISTSLDSIAGQYNDNKAQQESLAGQVNNIKTQINTTNTLITDTRIVISQLEKQLKENEIQRDILNESIKDILKQVQIKNRLSTIEIIFSGSDLGSVLSQIYSLSTLQERLDSKKLS
jgi:chromosome segregation ATPase